MRKFIKKLKLLFRRKDRKDGGNSESNTTKPTITDLEEENDVNTESNTAHAATASQPPPTTNPTEQSTTNIASESTVDPKNEKEASLLPTCQPQPTANVAEEPATNIKEEKEASLRPINELWNEAYDELGSKEDALIKNYEAILDAENKNSPEFSDKSNRSVQLQAILKRKNAEVDEKSCKLKIGSGHEISLTDLAAPVLKVVAGLSDYIAGVLSPNPYASIAWIGVSLLLPLLLNPSEQEASSATALEYISNLIIQGSLREEFYREKFESVQKETNLQSNARTAFRNSLKELYKQILIFQIKTVCHYSDRGVLKVVKNIVKWHDWDTLSKKIEKQEAYFLAMNRAFKDELDIKWRNHDQRHKESMEKWTDSINNEISRIRKAIELANQNSQRDQLLKWLSTVNPSDNYNNARERHKGRTGDWLVKENSKFQRWEYEPNSFLWLHGQAGAGKTILSSTVISYLKDLYDKDPRIGLGFFYFSFNDDQKQNASGMLSSLIRQLYAQLPDIPDVIQPLIQDKEKDHRPDLSKLESILATIVQCFLKVYVVIDALDECPANNGKRRTLLESLCRIDSMGLENLHVLCTSRQEPDIQSVLDTFLTKPSNLSFDESLKVQSFKADINLTAYQQHVNTDIGLFIDEELASAIYRWRPDVKIKARANLIQKADGMFQYISCQFDALKKCHTEASVEKALNNLPDGLDATYNRILLNLPAESHEKILSLLNWLAYSLRPLSLLELAETFALDKSQSGPFNKKERLQDSDDILVYLCGLVTTTEVTSNSRWNDQTQIRFAHFSVQEYLTSPRIKHGDAASFFISYDSAHLDLAESCLAYHQQISQTILISNISDLHHYPLWEYTTQNWGNHIEIAGTISMVEKWIQVLSSDPRCFLNLVRIFHRDGPGNDFSLEENDLPSLLCYIASLGLYRVTNHLINNGAEINYIPSEANWNGTALLVAIYFGYPDIVELLIQKGANVDLHCGRYGYALQTAVNANIDCGGYVSAQQAEAYVNKIKTLQLLLGQGAEINAQGGRYGNALQAAIHFEDIDIVQLLLKEGADVNAQGGGYGNALNTAVENGNIDIVRLLLEKGADINAQREHYKNALNTAVENDNVDIIRLLLKEGADINAQEDFCENALNTAVGKGNIDIIRLVLEKGADINMQGGIYGNALNTAVEDGNIDIIRLVLEKGADINMQGGIYGNALQTAAVDKNSLDIIQLLIEKGADVNMQGGEYGNALIAALIHRGYEIANLLILRGANSARLEAELEKKVLLNIKENWQFREDDFERLSRFWENPENFMEEWKKEDEEDDEDANERRWRRFYGSE